MSVDTISIPKLLELIEAIVTSLPSREVVLPSGCWWTIGPDEKYDMNRDPEKPLALLYLEEQWEILAAWQQNLPAPAIALSFVPFLRFMGEQLDISDGEAGNVLDHPQAALKLEKSSLLAVASWLRIDDCNIDIAPTVSNTYCWVIECPERYQAQAQSFRFHPESLLEHLKNLTSPPPKPQLHILMKAAAELLEYSLYRTLRRI